MTVDLAPQAAWVVDYYPVDAVEDAPEDAWEEASLRVRMRTADTSWVHRLLLRLGAGPASSTRRSWPWRSVTQR